MRELAAGLVLLAGGCNLDYVNESVEDPNIVEDDRNNIAQVLPGFWTSDDGIVFYFNEKGVLDYYEIFFPDSFLCPATFFFSHKSNMINITGAVTPLYTAKTTDR